MAAVHETQPRGQVTERLLIMSTLNSVVAVLALKIWLVISSADVPVRAELPAALANSVYVLCGSFLLGALLGLALNWLSGPIRRAEARGVLQIGLLVLGALLAAQWSLSPLLALLLAGMVARERMGHRLAVERRAHRLDRVTHSRRRHAPFEHWQAGARSGIRRCAARTVFQRRRTIHRGSRGAPVGRVANRRRSHA